MAICDELLYNHDELDLQFDFGPYCEKYAEAITSTWSTSDTTPETKSKAANDTRDDVLQLARMLQQRDDLRQLSDDADLAGFHQIFRKLRQYNVYAFMCEGSEEGLMKRYPHLRPIQERSHRQRCLDQNQRARVHESWPMDDEDGTINPDGLQARSHKEALDELMEYKPINWILQLSNLARKVDQKAAQHVIRYALKELSTQGTRGRERKVSYWVLVRANTLVHNVLIAHDWECRLHHTVEFNVAEQSRNSRTVVSDLQLDLDCPRLDLNWQPWWPRARPADVVSSQLSQGRSTRKSIAKAKRSTRRAESVSDTPVNIGWAEFNGGDPGLVDVEEESIAKDEQDSANSVAKGEAPNAQDRDIVMIEDEQSICTSSAASPTSSVAADETGHLLCNKELSATDDTSVSWPPSPAADAPPDRQLRKMGDVQVIQRKETKAWRREIRLIADSSNEGDFVDCLLSVFDKYFAVVP